MSLILSAHSRTFWSSASQPVSGSYAAWQPHEREELSLMRTRDKAEAVDKHLESDRKTGEAARVLWDERERRYRSTQVGAGWGRSSLSQECKDRVAHARETLHSTFSGIVYLGLWLHSIHSAVEEDR